MYAHVRLIGCFNWSMAVHVSTSSFFAFKQNAHTGTLCPRPTSVMVVPAPGVVVLEDLWWAPSLQQVVHLVLLPPGQRLAKDLPRLVHVEVPGAQETQYVLVLRDLDSKGWAFSIVNKFKEIITKDQNLSQLSQHCQRHCQSEVKLTICTTANGKSVSHISSWRCMVNLLKMSYLIITKNCFCILPHYYKNCRTEHYLSLVRLLQPFAKSDKTALLQGGQVP